MSSSTELEKLDAPPPISLAVALDIIGRVSKNLQLPVESVALASAHHRVLAEICTTPIDQPPFDNAAMDGIALRGSELGEREVTLQLCDTVLAGHATSREVPAGACVRITTGAPMPPGTDTVVVREVLKFEGDRVRVPAGQKPGTNVRKAGENLRRGQPALSAGVRLQSRHVAMLASLGLATAEVHRAPRLSVFSTGDELASPGAVLEPGLIHDSNGPMLRAQAESAACSVLRQGHLPDDPEQQLASLREAAVDSDVIVTAGGVSMGEADYLPRLINAHGRIHFWRVRMKPGLPILFGELDGCLIFGLPGNPVSTAVGFTVLVQHALDALQASESPRRLAARLRSDLKKRHRRAEFVRGQIQADAGGSLWFEAHRQQGSAALSGLAASNCLALLDEDLQDPVAGTVCRIWPLPGAFS